MELGLVGRRALVTAASKGIGLACAHALAGEGARVFICSRDKAAIEAAARDIGAAGWATTDLSRGGEPEAVVAAAVDALGGIDSIVVNAGGPPAGDFRALSLDSWTKAFDLTLMSAVRLLKAATPYLERSEQGRIVFITSIAVRQPIRELTLSNSMRAAVTGLAKSLSAELAPMRITVNCIAPDAIRSDALKRLADARGGSLAEMEAVAPMNRLGEPSEVGAACAFLCSRQAGFITGQTLGIDGGSLVGVH